MVDLNDNLMPVNSPIAENQGQVTAFGFDSNNERNVVSTSHIRNLTADAIGAGTISVRVNIGGAQIYIDGANNRIIINDGTVDRILIGYLASGF